MWLSAIKSSRMPPEAGKANHGLKPVLRAPQLMYPEKAKDRQKSVLRAAQLMYPEKADGLKPVLRAPKLMDPGKAKDGLKSILKAPQFKYDGNIYRFLHPKPLDPEEPMDIDIMCEEEPMDTS